MYINTLAPFALFSELFRQSFTGSSQCPTDLPLTCRNDTAVPDTCCFEYPGGIFLQTQFWDYRPSRPNLDKEALEKELGPLDEFTIHGLWPDKCDGGYEQFCDNSRSIDDVYHLLNLEQFNNPENGLEISGKDLLTELNRLWKSNNGNDESLWIHEYNKHGTCIKTIRPKCYENWKSKAQKPDLDLNKQSVYDYFRTAYNLYKKLNTSAILKAHGIRPSTTATYTREEIASALSVGFDGHSVFFACDRHNAINEIWYYHLLKGSLLGEEFTSIDSIYRGRERCPERGIKFFPKGYTPPDNRAPSPKFSGIIRLSGIEGGLIKNGHWMVNMSPATFFLSESEFGNYYLRSRLGYCGFNQNQALACNKNLGQAAQFEYEDGYIGYSGSFQWGGDTYPSHRSQSIIYHDPEGGDEYSFKLKFIKKTL